MGSTSIGRRGLAGGNDHLLLFVGLPRVESMSIPVVNSKGANENGRAGRRINVKMKRVDRNRRRLLRLARFRASEHCPAAGRRGGGTGARVRANGLHYFN